MTVRTADGAGPWRLDDRRLLAASGIAAVVNLALFVLGDALGATWVTISPLPISPIVVVAATLLPLLVAGAVVRRIGAGHPARVRGAAWLGLIVAVAGLPMPFVASSDPTTALMLAPMHVTAGIAWFVGLRGGR